MAAPRGVTYTLSDYRALGPPFPGGLHFSYYPFFWGGGCLFFSPFFPLTCLYSFHNLVPRALFPGFGAPPPKPGKSALGTRLGKVCSPLAKVDKSLREPRSAVRLVPGPPPPPTCFRCGWIGHYANRLSFQLYARRGATISASCPRPQFR